MKVYILTADLSDYTAVSFGKITLPLVIQKKEKVIATKPEENIKNYIKEVVGIAHGNGKNKELLIKEVREKVPGLTRKSAQISDLLKNCFTKTEVEGLKGKRQMVDIEKLTTVYGPQDQLNLEEILASKKAVEPPIIPAERKSLAMSRKSVTPTRPNKNNLTTNNLLYDADDENPKQRPKSMMRPHIQSVLFTQRDQLQPNPSPVAG